MGRTFDHLLPFVGLLAFATALSGCGGTDETIDPPLAEECFTLDVPPSLPGIGPELEGEGLEPPVDAPQSLAVEFVETPGFYTDYFELTLASNHPQAEIYFTLDGSEPDPESAEYLHCTRWLNPLSKQTFRYRGPIDLTAQWTRDHILSRVKTTTDDAPRGWIEPADAVATAAVVRAKAVLGEHTSPVITGTYFVEEQGRSRFNLPVVSLTTEARQLFDDRTGIYVPGPDPDSPNFAQRGREWERPAHLEYFDERGERPIAQPIGVRIHGNFTRKFPQKSLRVYARKEYGLSQIRYPLFESKDTQQFKRLLLRNGGNDWGFALSRDAIFQSLLYHLPLETQHARPSVLFINGEYWGVHMIQEYLDPFHLELRYGIPREHITIFENNAQLSDGSEADLEHYRRFLDDLASGNLTTAEAIDQYLALNEFIDYLIAEVYSGNTDWPHNNIGYWRYSRAPIPASVERGPRDGRWRPLVYDVDRTMGRSGSQTANMVQFVFGDKQDHWSRQLFSGVIQVASVRDEFIQRMAVHLATTFRTDRVDEAISRYTQAMEVAMPDQIQRWGTPRSLDAYYSDVEAAHRFASRRPALVRQHMADFFRQISGTAKIRIHNINPENPPTVHGIRLTADTPGVVLESGTWEATIFSGVPFVLHSPDLDWSTVVIDGEARRNQRESELRLTLYADNDVDVHL